MNNFFPILAIETSAELCSAAVLFDEKKYIELNYLQKHIHSQKLIDLIDAVLKNGDTEIRSCKAVAVSMGPGSFTGLRIGLAAAKGLALGADLPIIPVPTFDALAFTIAQTLSQNKIFAIVVNASMDEYYIAKFVRKNNLVQTISELTLIEKDSLKSFVDEEELIFGNSSLDPSFNEITASTAYTIGRWTYLFGNHLLTYDYDYLEPNYFKKFIVKVKK